MAAQGRDQRTRALEALQVGRGAGLGRWWGSKQLIVLRRGTTVEASLCPEPTGSAFVKVGKTIFTLVIAATLGLSRHSVAQDWPTTDFLVREGSPYMDYSASQSAQKTLGKLSSILNHPGDALSGSDGESAEPPPLSAAVKADMEAYLQSVADYLKQASFPAPLLVRTDQMANPPGTQIAYPAYFYAFPPERSTEYAYYSHVCDNGSTSYIHINGPQFLSGGKITAKGFGDLAHELFHAVQRNTRVGRENCKSGYGAWINEGQAEAFGHDMARKFRAKAGDAPLSRWGGRQSYAAGLYVKSSEESSYRHDLAYQTSSLWRYLAEAWHLRERGQASGGAKPGPDMGSDYGTDYGYLALMMDRSFEGGGARAELQWLNDWLEGELWGGLDRVYTDFISVFADYGAYRITSKRSVKESRRRWRDVVLGGNPNKNYPACKTVTLNQQQPDGAAKLTLKKVASSCIEVDISAYTTPKTFDISITTADKPHMRQLHLTLAGGQQLQMAAPMKDIPESGRVMSSWRFEMDPAESQVLIITNVARKPGSTRIQDIDVAIALAGHDSSEQPQPYRSGKRQQTTGATVKPGPAGARQARTLRHQKMVGETHGAGSTRWEYKPQPNKCSSKNHWRINCEAMARIELTIVHPAEMGGITPSSDASGGIIASMMEMVPSANFEEIGQFQNYLDDTPGITVALEVPGIDYGYTGTVSDARIRVSGGRGNHDLISFASKPVDPHPPCTYGPPVGRVTIEEFSPAILRGSYTAAVIEAAFPRNVKRCPAASVVKNISGSFIVTAPLMQDQRGETDVSWYKEFAFSEAANFVPAGFDSTNMPNHLDNMPALPKSIGQPMAASGLADDWEVDVDDCACDCDEFRAAMKASTRLMMGAAGEPDKESMRLLSCMGLCAAKVSDCPM